MTTVIRIADYLAEKAPQPVAQTLEIGATVELGSLRVHRYRDVLVLWDLTNAGKRGRKVRRLSVSAAFRTGIDRDATLEQLACCIENLSSLEAAEQVIGAYLDGGPGSLDVSYNEERGIDVTPAEFKTIKIETSRLSLEVGYRDFTVRNLADTNNRPTCIPSGSVKTIPVFYRWASQNVDRIAAMSYLEVLREMTKLGIQYHDYSAND